MKNLHFRVSLAIDFMRCEVHANKKAVMYMTGHDLDYVPIFKRLGVSGWNRIYVNYAPQVLGFLFSAS